MAGVRTGFAVSQSHPVGESRADDRPWRKGPLVDAVKSQARRLPTSVDQLVPRSLKGFPFTAPTAPRGVELPAEPSTLGVDYDTDWAREPLATVTRRILQETVVRGGVELLASPTVRGADRLTGLKGPVIFAANHHSHIDTSLLLASVPRRFRRKTVVAAGADYFFDKRWKAIGSALTINAVPIERLKVSRTSSDRLLGLLNDGWSLVIFPEGGRSPDGWGQDFKPGAAFLAVRRQCPIVPVHVEGADEVLPKGGRLRRHACTVTFGLPIRPTDGEDARRLNARIEAAVNELADEHRSNWWSARQRAAAGTTPPLTGPESNGWRRAWAQGNRKATRDTEAEANDARWPR
jgi:1-acyl-sn-glycerol-3-phosphate acyltransferase